MRITILPSLLFQHCQSTVIMEEDKSAVSGYYQRQTSVPLSDFLSKILLYLSQANISNHVHFIPLSSISFLLSLPCNVYLFIYFLVSYSFDYYSACTHAHKSTHSPKRTLKMMTQSYLLTQTHPFFK